MNTGYELFSTDRGYELHIERMLDHIETRYDLDDVRDCLTIDNQYTLRECHYDSSDQSRRTRVFAKRLVFLPFHLVNLDDIYCCHINYFIDDNVFFQWEV